MNRKLLNGFMAAAILTGGAMSVTSCKDTDEDLFVQLKSETVTLENKVKILEDAKTTLEDKLSTCSQNCANAWTTFKGADYKDCTTFESYLNEYAKIYGEHATLAWYLEQIDGALKKTDEDGNVIETYNSLSERFGEIDLALEGLTSIEGILDPTDVAAIKKYFEEENTDFPTVIKQAVHADSLAQNNQAILEALLKGYEEADGSFDLTKIQGLMKTASDNAASAKAAADSAKTLANQLKLGFDTIKDRVSALELRVDTLKNDLDALTVRVAANEKAISKLNTQVSAITGRLNKLITSIVLQEAYNPVFGKLNLPVDVKSGMLMAYFGEASGVPFPAINSSAYEYDSNTSWISQEEATRAGIKSETFNGILGVEDGKLELGDIYMSVNPASVDLDGATFQLVNSKGENNNVMLTPVAKSDVELMFGFGRADSDVPNGLYKTTAYVNVNSIEDLAPVRFTVGDEFKSDVETMLKNHTLSDVASLTKLIYNQFNNKLAAKGVRAAYTYDEVDEDGNVTSKTDATYSEFALATTAFKPLSYELLYGKGFNTISTINPISDFTLNQSLNIEMPNFDFNLDNVTFNFSFGEIKVELTDTEIEVTVPRTIVYNNLGEEMGYIKETTATASDLSGLEEAISKAISEQLSTQDANLQQAFKDAMSKVASDINSQINSKMDEFKTNIESQFNDIISNIEGKVNDYLGTVNKYINKVNSLINRVNKILSNPNHYLQVTMLFEGSDSELHNLSSSSALPSTFVLANNKNGLKIYPTSYTGDILVPSYKKFVAVTNVYRTGDSSKTPVTSEIAKANGVEDWNTVIPGTTSSLAMELTKGYTYEIVYSSLDYHGKASTRKFYISAE